MTEPLGIGVIGAGRIANVHSSNLAKISQVRLVAVADVIEKAAKDLSRRYGMKSYTNYKRLLKRDDIDVVVICTPNHLHAPIAIDAAEAGKHIFCEKPMATTLQDAESMIVAATKARVKLTVGFMLRFTPPHPRIKEMVERGAMGSIVVMRADAYGWPPAAQWSYEPDKGMGVLDVVIHHVDMFRWLGGRVDAVYAAGGAYVYENSKKCGTADNAVILLKFRSGTTGDVYTSFSTGYGNLWMEIIGVKGSIYLNYLDRQSITVFLKEAFQSDGSVMPAGWSYPDVVWEYGYRGEIEHFIKCIVEDKKPIVTGEDGRASLEILLAAMKSMRTGEIVKLPLKA